MMKPRFNFWTVSLVAVMAVSACAPATPSASSAVEMPTQATVTLLPPATSTPDISTPPDTSALDTSTPLPIATSRGPNLEATDPATVALASGGLQLIEFFRFT